MNNDLKEELYDLQNVMQSVNCLIESSTWNLSPENKKTLFSFRDYLLTRQISILRVRKYLMFCRIFTEYGKKDFVNYTKADIDSVMGQIRLSGRYKTNSINDLITTLKMLFRFIEGLSDDEQSPRTKHLKKKKSESNLKLEDMLSDDDVNKLVSTASAGKDGLMWSCLLSVLRETGWRPGEIRGIVLKDVIKNTHGYRINVNGKTGKRVVFSITSSPLLEKWINSHAFKNPEAPLFYLAKDGEPRFLKHSHLSKIIRVLGKKVLDRSLTPYHFRHTMITDCVRKGIQDSKIRYLIGHAPGSKALSTYTHLDAKDSEDTALRLAGIDTEQKKIENKFAIKTCPKCNTGLSPHEAICGFCGTVVDQTSIISAEADKEVRYQMLEKLLDIFEQNPKWFTFLQQNLPKVCKKNKD